MVHWNGCVGWKLIPFSASDKLGLSLTYFQGIDDFIRDDVSCVVWPIHCLNIIPDRYMVKSPWNRDKPPLTQWRKSTGFWLFCNGRIFSLPHFQFKIVNISTIITPKLKTCVCVWRLVSWLSLGIYISWVESSVNKQIRLNCALFVHRVQVHFSETYHLTVNFVQRS